MNNYKVRINDTVPKKHVFSDKSCFVGISLFNPIFRKNVIYDFSQWIDKNFTDCEMVIADYLYRYNYMMYYGLSEKEAIKLCSRDGQYLCDKLKALIPFETIKIIAWKAYFDSNIFQNHLKNINNFYYSNNEFKTQIDESANQFINRQKYKIHMNFESSLVLSTKYLIEEFAFISFMIERGKSISVYPGKQLSMLKDIVENKKYTSEVNLSRAVYIDVKLKKK